MWCKDFLMHFAVGFWFVVVREAVFLCSGGSRERGAQKMLKNGHGVCSFLCVQGEELEKEPLTSERWASQARNQETCLFKYIYIFFN